MLLREEDQNVPLVVIVLTDGKLLLNWIILHTVAHHRCLGKKAAKGCQFVKLQPVYSDVARGLCMGVLACKEPAILRKLGEDQKMLKAKNICCS